MSDLIDKILLRKNLYIGLSAGILILSAAMTIAAGVGYDSLQKAKGCTEIDQFRGDIDASLITVMAIGIVVFILTAAVLGTAVQTSRSKPSGYGGSVSASDRGFSGTFADVGKSRYQ